MAQRPPAPLSPQARRQAQQQALGASLARRDRSGFAALLAQWAHRQGVASLQPLLLELGAQDPEGMLWWNASEDDRPEVTEEAPAPVLSEQEPELLTAKEPEPLPLAAPLSRLRVVPKPAQRTRPAPAPSHPGLAQLRSWLPDQEAPRAA